MFVKDDAMPELYAALAAAQGQFKPIAKNRTVTIKPREGPAYQFKYADLETILAAVRPGLAANGLAFVQVIHSDQGGAVMQSAILHSAGGALVSEFGLPSAGERDPKQYGALLTYIRRYMATAMLGVAADDDLEEDGKDAGEDKRSMEGVGGKRNDPPKPPSPPAIKTYTDDEFAANLPAWNNVIQSGRKTPDALIAMLSTKASLTDEQKAKIRGIVKPAEDVAVTEGAAE